MTQVTTAEASRIMSHMNKDHQESLGHYLEYFAKLPRVVAYSSPQITKFTSEGMTIEYGRSSRSNWNHSFTPRMEAGQARVRLEQMHKEAKEGLGISDITINSLHLSPSAWVSTGLCLALNLYLLLTPSPTISHTFRWMNPLIRPILSALSLKPTQEMLGDSIRLFWCGSLGLAHFVEIFACLNPLLRKYNVKSPLVRFLYMLFTQIGGFPVWGSLKEEGVRQEREAKKQ